MAYYIYIVCHGQETLTMRASVKVYEGKSVIIILFKLLFLKVLDEYIYIYITRFSYDDASLRIRRIILMGHYNLPKI